MIEPYHARKPSLPYWDANNPTAPFYLQSKAMPGATLTIWRTDGLTTPLHNGDIRTMAEQKWPLGKCVHLHHYHRNGNTRFDLVAEVLSPIPEVPESLEAAHS